MEYASVFFREKWRSGLRHLKVYCCTADVGVNGICINVEEEGELGSPDKTLREHAVQNHLRWISAARILGLCL
ncbi:MAG: hypothetical protein U0T82_07905 [Bacteroidales bacterium]